MTDDKYKIIEEQVPSSGRGPMGLGDPNDRKLRKVERDLIISKMVLEEAEKRCFGPFKVFLDCAKEAGLLVTFKCKKENNARNDCISSWTNNPELIKEITDKYIDARNHYRRTGQALNKYVRVKKTKGNAFC